MEDTELKKIIGGMRPEMSLFDSLDSTRLDVRKSFFSISKQAHSLLIASRSTASILESPPIRPSYVHTLLAS